MILILNCGSQTIKFKLFDKDLAKIKGGQVSAKNPQEYRGFLISELKKIKDIEANIEIIGHRVVYGSRDSDGPVRITAGVLKELKKYETLAPLHQPYNLLGIRTAQKIFPKAKQLAVFDTAFFKGLPIVAKTYALPQNLRVKYGLERFGFHGISHEYAAREAAKKFKKPLAKLKIITCHLGGGASITAVRNGKAFDTSMGLTPLAGLVMMTRAGSIDPGILLYLGEKAKISNQKLKHILNYESGVKGICGKGDMLEVLQAMKKGNKKAGLALDVFVYAIKKYIGAYYAILNGCDILVFTGAIGFGSAKIRNMICKNLDILKRTKVLAIKSNEELAIAQKIKEEL